MAPNRSHSRNRPKSTQPTTVKCGLCNRHFRNKQSLNTHVRICHDGDKARLAPLKCPKDGCTMTYWGRPSFMKHMVKHGISASAAARIADQAGSVSRISVTPPTLSDTSQGSSGRGVYTCPECEETFMALVDMDVHLEEHQDDSSSSMSLEDQDSHDHAKSTAQNTSTKEMEHPTDGGAQEEEEEEEEDVNEGLEATVVSKLDQLKKNLDRASGSYHITEFVLRFLKPVIMEESSGNEIAVYMPNLKEVSGCGIQDKS
ncbi:hypothetical protein BGZ93_010887 [Podila epicladia]|nr:hypothetical protein BGZ92_009297 [Podila epicladia]KAG0100564.1 hypothetical protein BGZ93_010887 [Podila epicladia]